jgi:hypothetical protein
MFPEPTMATFVGFTFVSVREHPTRCEDRIPLDGTAI